MKLPAWATSGVGYVLVIGYQLAAIATFGKLTFFDGYAYNWWNWLIALPVNVFLASIWPLYWGVLRPILGS